MTTETKTSPAARKVQEQQHAEGQALREQSAKQYKERMKGRPTPTQEECDQIKLGMHPELSPDGSDPDPAQAKPVEATPPTRSRQMEAGSAPSSYQTRSAKSAE